MTGTFTARDTDRARELRNQVSPAERKLWRALSGRKIAEYKFSRQMPVGPYFADFLCREAKLIVEVDGYSHDLRMAHDQSRDAFLLSQGYRVLRVTNQDVMRNMDGVLVLIAEALRHAESPPQPSPEGEGLDAVEGQKLLGISLEGRGVKPALAIHDDDVRLTPEAPDMRVSFAASEDQAQAVARALDILAREGVVVLDDLVDPALLAECRGHIDARYPDHARYDAERHYGSYPGRHTAPLVIDGPLAHRDIFIPRAADAIAAAMLGSERILESFGLLVSTPGAPNQGRHHDGLLFADTNLDRILPCFALSLAMPLVPLDAVNGTTAFWRRSHRKPGGDGPPDFAPALPVGSALMWDFRIHHSGRSNSGAVPRPILFAVHSRDWWQAPDTIKATHYRALSIARTAYDRLDPPTRTLLCRADIIE